LRIIDTAGTLFTPDQKIYPSSTLGLSK